MNLFEKLSNVANEIGVVAKNLSIENGKYSYKAVGEGDVLAAIKPLEQKHRVFSYPSDRQVIESGVLTSVDRNGNEKKQNFLRIETTYRFVDMDKPSDYIEVKAYGDGIDSGDKAPGKAITYSDKYALLKCYKMITGDDPDQYASEPLKGYEKKEVKVTKVQADAMLSRCEKAGINIPEYLGRFGVNSFEDLTIDQYSKMHGQLTKAGK